MAGPQTDSTVVRHQLQCSLDNGHELSPGRTAIAPHPLPALARAFAIARSGLGARARAGARSEELRERRRQDALQCTWGWRRCTRFLCRDCLGPRATWGLASPIAQMSKSSLATTTTSSKFETLGRYANVR